MREITGRLRCFGSTTVGARGQVVIPANARRELGLNTGDTILVFCAPPQQQGVLLLKAEAVEEMLSQVSEVLTDLQKLVRERKSKSSRGKEGDG